MSADACRGGRLAICGEAEDYPASRASVRLAVTGNGTARSKGAETMGKIAVGRENSHDIEIYYEDRGAGR
jgi:hypothetical protein